MPATGNQLSLLVRRSLQQVDSRPSGMVDLMFRCLTLEAFTPRGVMKMTLELMQQSATAAQLLMPGQENRVIWQELKNKVQTFDLFEFVDWAMSLPSGADFSLTEQVERASAFDAYQAVWATEGLGHYSAETVWQRGQIPHHLLTGEKTRGLPAKSLVPLHAGMGLSLANQLLKPINPHTPAAGVRDVLGRFVRLCQDNSREGYAEAAYEALGLVARNLYPPMVRIIDEQLLEIDQDLVGYFWHGVGRAIYFAPTNFLPLGDTLGQAVQMSQREPPHEVGRLNALAGLAWALALVNIRQPEILETFLNQHADHVAQSDAFSNGVASSIVIWRDATEDDHDIAVLCQHQPDSSNPALIERWRCQVVRPCQDAVHHYYGALKQQHCLGQVFRYQSLPELVGRLERTPRATTS
jgi:hypothetical protein